jgi:hypothetical protein
MAKPSPARQRLETPVPAQRPLGKIRLTRLRANGGATPDAANPGRHRRPAEPDADNSPARVGANQAVGTEPADPA